MRRLIGTVVLLAGCASTNEYVTGPPTTVREPSFSGQVRPREPAYNRSAVAPAQASTPIPTYPRAGDSSLPPPEPRQPQAGGFFEWVRSGRGWAWGQARRGPIRDEGLDRAMVDTLTSDRPGYSRNPVAVPTPVVPEPWIYPSQAPSGGRPRSSGNISAGGANEE